MEHETKEGNLIKAIGEFNSRRLGKETTEGSGFGSLCIGLTCASAVVGAFVMYLNYDISEKESKIPKTQVEGSVVMPSAKYNIEGLVAESSYSREGLFIQDFLLSGFRITGIVNYSGDVSEQYGCEKVQYWRCDVLYRGTDKIVSTFNPRFLYGNKVDQDWQNCKYSFDVSKDLENGGYTILCASPSDKTDRIAYFIKVDDKKIKISK